LTECWLNSRRAELRDALTYHDAQAVDHYGDPLAAYSALTQSVGILDLSLRGRLCLTGADRARLLIGLDVIARLRAHGQVHKRLCGLRLDDALKQPPAKGDKLFHEDKEAGYITSAVASPTLQANLALGYVRREANRLGTELQLKSATSESLARIVALPFVKRSPAPV
jgi:glycine cleavage system aminomethyltransferase T